MWMEQRKTLPQETDVKIIDKNGEEFTDTDMGYLNVSTSICNCKTLERYSQMSESKQSIQRLLRNPAIRWRSVKYIRRMWISVAGSEEGLATTERAEQYDLAIPDYVADISDRDSDFEEKINISDYLPDGLKLTSDSSEDMFVRVNVITGLEAVYVKVPTKNIVVNHAPDGMQVSI